MQLNEQEQEAIIERASEILADRVEEEIRQTFSKSLGQAVTVPLSLAARIIGVSAKQARRILPLCKTSPASVQMADVMECIERRKS